MERSRELRYCESALARKLLASFECIKHWEVRINLRNNTKHSSWNDRCCVRSALVAHKQPMKAVIERATMSHRGGKRRVRSGISMSSSGRVLPTCARLHHQRLLGL